MSSKQSPLTEAAVRAMQGAVRKVIEEHRRRRRPMAVWKDERVVLIDPDVLPVVRESRAPYGRPAGRGDTDAD